MNCEEATRLMDGYLDGELDPITNQAIEQHLRECAACARAYKAHGSFVGAIGSAAPYYKAPAGLRERIQASLREEVGERSAPNGARDNRPSISKTQTSPRTILLEPSWNWLALAAAIVFAAIIAFNFVPRMRRSDGDQFLATQLIASHVRSLMASHLTDVTSTDQHTVKPWLDTKLDFAPPVVDLSSEGFPLIGGRLDYLDNRPAAVLVYQRRKHFINLFVWPVDPKAKKEADTISRQGYHLLNWTDSDFNYWAVSDVNADDLQILKQKFEAKTSHH
jgi:anti-sigma factor RsiW